MKVALSDRKVPNVERTRRLETEPSVIRGISEQGDKGVTSPLGAIHQLVHQSAADAASLVRWQYRERSHSDGLATSEVATRSKHMSDDRAAFHGHQL